MSIVVNENRIGRFTSSKISDLIKPGRSSDFTAGGNTYIKSKYYERKLKRSLDLGKNSQPALWGLFLEQYVYSHFTGLSYVIMSNDTKIHPTIKYLAGSTDLLVPGEKASDIKCFEPLKFCQIVECFAKDDVNLFKKDFPKEYWQLVSNAMINQVPKAESIIYMPTMEDLEEIREMAYGYEGDDQWKYRFIYENPNYQLPYVPDGSDYQSYNAFEFLVPEDDIALLTTRVAMAELEIKKLVDESNEA